MNLFMSTEENTKENVMENKTVSEVFEEIEKNDLGFLPEEQRAGFMTTIKFMILAI